MATGKCVIYLTIFVSLGIKMIATGGQLLVPGVLTVLGIAAICFLHKKNAEPK